jgi:hypothetical protein
VLSQADQAVARGSPGPGPTLALPFTHPRSAASTYLHQPLTALLGLQHHIDWAKLAAMDSLTVHVVRAAACSCTMPPLLPGCCGCTHVCSVVSVAALVAPRVRQPPRMARCWVSSPLCSPSHPHSHTACALPLAPGSAAHPCWQL